MTSLLNTIISLIIGAGVGSGATYYFMPKPGATTKTISSTERVAAPTTRGTDTYEIRWYGKPKDEYWGGNYTIMKPGSPMEVVEIPKSPHIVKIQLPKQSFVAAGGDVQEIKIFKNGKECGKPGIVGKGIPLNKGCQPKL